MQLTRNLEGENYVYRDEDGAPIANRFEVLVDGRRVVADIAKLDTEEGWVDIEIPTLAETIELTETIGVNAERMPVFDIQVKRVYGKITVVELV